MRHTDGERVKTSTIRYICNVVDGRSYLELILTSSLKKKTFNTDTDTKTENVHTRRGG